VKPALAHMSRNYIDFISAYCDSWCERCAFTSLARLRGIMNDEFPRAMKFCRPGFDDPPGRAAR
jgi:hypothetical protein